MISPASAEHQDIGSWIEKVLGIYVEFRSLGKIMRAPFLMKLLGSLSGRERGEKFVEYERAGVHEYWLIDPDRESAEFYELAGDGRYRLTAIAEDGTYRSKVISGF